MSDYYCPHCGDRKTMSPEHEGCQSWEESCSECGNEFIVSVQIVVQRKREVREDTYPRVSRGGAVQEPDWDHPRWYYLCGNNPSARNREGLIQYSRIPKAHAIIRHYAKSGIAGLFVDTACGQVEKHTEHDADTDIKYEPERACRNCLKKLEGYNASRSQD